MRYDVTAVIKDNCRMIKTRMEMWNVVVATVSSVYNDCMGTCQCSSTTLNGKDCLVNSRGMQAEDLLLCITSRRITNVLWLFNQ